MPPPPPCPPGGGVMTGWSAGVVFRWKKRLGKNFGKERNEQEGLSARSFGMLVSVAVLDDFCRKCTIFAGSLLKFITF